VRQNFRSASRFVGCPMGAGSLKLYINYSLGYNPPSNGLFKEPKEASMYIIIAVMPAASLNPPLIKEK
jgi:hypothetical protein